MVQVPQAAGSLGLAADEYDYDLFPLSQLAIATGTQQAISNVVPDGYTLKIARLTLVNTGAAGKLLLQIVSQATGVVTPYGSAGTQTVFTYELASLGAQFFSEDQLELTVPAGFQLFASVGAGVWDVTAHAREIPRRAENPGRIAPV